MRIRPGTTPTAGNDKTVSIELKDTAGATKEYITALTSTIQRELSINNDGEDIDFRVETVAQSSAFKIDAAGETASFDVPVSAATTVTAGTGVTATTGSITAIAGDIIAGGTGLVSGGTTPGGISSDGQVMWRAEASVPNLGNIDPANGSHFLLTGAQATLQAGTIPGQTITIYQQAPGTIIDLNFAPIITIPAFSLVLDDQFSSIQLYNSVAAGGWVVVADSGRISPA